MAKTFREHMSFLEGTEKQTTIVRIAKACNVNLGTVARWVYSNDYPKAANREIIARLLGLPILELFPKKEN